MSLARRILTEVNCFVTCPSAGSADPSFTSLRCTMPRRYCAPAKCFDSSGLERNMKKPSLEQKRDVGREAIRSPEWALGKKRLPEWIY